MQIQFWNLLVFKLFTATIYDEGDSYRISELCELVKTRPFTTSFNVTHILVCCDNNHLSAQTHEKCLIENRH